MLQYCQTIKEGRDAVKIKGVNLGNWLVLEKWMSTELFEGIQAHDEEDFYHALPPEEAALRLRMHRSYFIQERDFQNIAALGFNAVRIPVPHYIFGGQVPYVGCIEYLDRAFDWAEKYGLLVLVDVHTVPDSQNGFDNGGLTGVIKWHHKPENISGTVELIDRLADRCAHRPALYGIKLLNEPVSDWMYEFTNEFTKERYKAADPVRAEGSTPVPTDVLQDFYLRGYEAVRRHSSTAKVVLHDGFRLEEWQDFMPVAQYPGTVLDTHLYLAFQEPAMPGRELADYASVIERQYAARLRQASRTHEVIVGEWCVANKSTAVGAAGLAARAWAYRMIGDLQLNAWQNCADWFYWSYKLHAENRSDWDVCRALQSGWLKL